MNPVEPIILNFSYKIHGKSTDCGVKKTNRNGKDGYMVCANIDGESKEFPMHYNSATKRYNFDETAPEELKVLEDNISSTIADGTSGELTDTA